MTSLGQIQRTPITLGDFITDQFDQEENRSLDELFRDRTRLLNQLSQTRSNRNRRTYNRQLRNIDRLIAERNSPTSSQPLAHQEQNTDDPGAAASSSSSAPPVPVEPEQLAAADTPADGSWWGFTTGVISALALTALGVAAFSNKEAAAQVAQKVSEVAQQLLPTKESSLAVVKAIRDQIKADKIVQSWSPSVRRAFNRAIDELIRQVEKGKLIKGIDYTIGNGRGFWGKVGNFVLTPIFFKG